MYLVDSTGRKVVHFFTYSFDIFKLMYATFRTAIFYQSQGYRTVINVVCAQIYFTGVQALTLVSILAIATGGIVVLQSASQFNILNANGNFLGQIMVLISVREVGPLLTALIVVARSGTAVASELGSLKVNREIEALETMAINPLSYIVFPRILGGIISVVCLSLYFVFASIFGGYLVTAFFHGAPLDYYISSIARAFTMDDVFLFLIKNIFSGCIIFAVSCYQGLSVRQGSHEVPQVTTRAVMDSIIYVLIFNFSITFVYYFKNLMQLGVL